MKRLMKAIFGLFVTSVIITMVPFGKVLIVIVFAVLLIKELGLVKITIHKP
jgi:hypothetical protein